MASPHTAADFFFSSIGVDEMGNIFDVVKRSCFRCGQERKAMRKPWGIHSQTHGCLREMQNNPSGMKGGLALSLPVDKDIGG